MHKHPCTKVVFLLCPGHSGLVGGLFTRMNRVHLGRWGQALDVNTPCVFRSFHAHSL